MKRILLTGGSGILGTELQKHRKYIVPSHNEMDITDFNFVKLFFNKHKPPLIIHAAAYTDVSKPDKEPEEMAKCYLANVIGTRNIVNAAGSIPIIYISTEYVLEPVNFYALTKLQGEKEVERAKNYYIIRTTFKPRPFEHPRACTDVWTIGDYVDVIASLIDKFIENPKGKIVYIGTGKKTVYELAKKTRPDVKPIKRKDVEVRLPSLKGPLDSVELFKI
ncbi:hypothetical protein A3D36_02555 [Candidatus Nomurabacteria bacterium RIFCSPHIGHO2_02_FULL_36_29]|nr:MAG: hypothetical protein A3D36_02555 [Candidatus Nomurabacteria bacterium RIFCSPHIGHO2_02_FULL_36_29]